MGKTYQSIIINAPVEKVWNTVKNFHDTSWSPNVITKCDKIGDVPGDQVGAKRVLNDVFHETLHHVDNDNCSFKYSVDEGPSPVSSNDVSNYIGNVKLTPSTLDNSTLVEWSSGWEKNDDSAAEFCHGIYVALLKDLKSTLG